MAQSLSRRRLDGNRPAGNDRGSHPLGQSRRDARTIGSINMVEAMPDTASFIRDDTGKPGAAELERAIETATAALLEAQRPDGHWVFELEADATIPAEYVLLRHYLGEPVDAALEQKIAVYLRRIQGEHGGWPLFHEGAFDMSASVKAYFALKMIGDPVDAPHMVRAREAIRSRGGAARSNVFTRFMFALFGVT